MLELQQHKTRRPFFPLFVRSFACECLQVIRCAYHFINRLKKKKNTAEDYNQRTIYVELLGFIFDFVRAKLSIECKTSAKKKKERSTCPSRRRQ